jgi:hypothetical protein
MAAGLSAQLTAGASIAASNNGLKQRITKTAGSVGCRAIRVRDRWWKPGADLGELAVSPEDTVEDPSYNEFWQDIDE